MKTRMNKLAVFVMMAAIAIFISAAPASALDPWGIVGEYGFSGGGGQISTPYSNWVSGLTLTDPTNVSYNTYHSYGILIFKHGGTGTIDLYWVGTSAVPPAWTPGYYHVTYPFTYTVNHDGMINWEAVTNSLKVEVLDPLTGVPTGLVLYRDNFSLTGYVSVDHKTITFATPRPQVDTIFLPTPSGLIPIQKVISNEAYVCNRIND